MARTVNNALYAGYQDITIYPYQDVASIDADQILLDIAKPGVYNAHVTSEVNADDVDITIHAGTTIVFRKSFTTTTPPTYTRNFVVKITITDDIVISNPKTSFDSIDDDSLVLICAWDWEQTYNSGTDKFASFILQPGTLASVYTDYLQYGDLIVCELLNHRAVIDTGDSSYDYIFAYQSLYGRQTDPTKVIKDYRDTFERLNNSANQFNVQFGKKVETLAGPSYYTKLYCVTGYGLIRDTAFTIDETEDGIPVPLETVPAEQIGSGTYQVDILRIVITDDVSNTPSLEWTSVGSNTAPTGTINRNNPVTIKQILAVLGTQEIPFVNDGPIIGMALRTRADIGDHLTSVTANTLWPYEFAQWNPGIPFIGHVPSATRVAIPVYSESDIDWS